MKKIDLRKMIDDLGLDESEVAENLFPMHNHPRNALYRLLRGEGVLDANQISRFSAQYNINIGAMFGDGWKATFTRKTHVFTHNHYEAVLDVETWTTKLYHKKSLFHTFILTSPSITLEEYLERLDTEIFKNQ